MKNVGLAAGSGDALDEIKEIPDYICKNRRDYGALKELTELIIAGKLNEIRISDGYS